MDRFWTTYYGDGIPADIEAEEITVVDFLDRAASRWPHRPALTLKGKTLTFRQLKEQVDRLATALAALGVGQGDCVALWMPNLPPMMIGYYAVLRLGARVANTNPLYVEREVEHLFNDAGAKVVITCDFLWWHRLRGMLDRVPKVEKVIVTAIPDYLPFPLNLLAPLKLKKIGRWVKVPKEDRVLFFKQLVRNSPPEPPKVEIGLDDVAVLQYTGGTTGVSKGAMLSHRNLSVNAQQCLAWFPVVELGEEVTLAALPYFHSFGMTVALNMPVLAGAHTVLIPDPRDIADIVNSLEKYRVTAFPAVPATFSAIASFPGIDKRDLSSLKACFSGSAPLPIDVLERFERLTGCPIIEGYGLTETSPVTHVNPLMGERKPGTVGLPIFGVDVKVVDLETGERELPIGEEGELCLRGPQIMVGYLNRPDETEKMIRDGWLHTGDLARIDAQGYTTIVGRKKDMIIAGGYNIYPDEIDDVLFAHPAVEEAGTIGLPDERRGETVKSFVVLRQGASATAEEIIEYCKKELAAYKVPKEIEFLDSLPRSPILKVLRRELRDRELEKRNA